MRPRLDLSGPHRAHVVALATGDWMDRPWGHDLVVRPARVKVPGKKREHGLPTKIVGNSSVRRSSFFSFA